MDRTDRHFSGWGLVAVAALALGTAGLYQFGWSSIRLPLGARLGVPEPALGTVFTVFVVCQTVGQFPAGWVRDRFGPRPPLLAGAVCLVAGFAGVAVAGSLPAAALAYAVGGLGASTAYTVAMNTPVKWFDDRRGLATGVVGMTYSGLSFLLIPGVRAGVAEAFETTLFALAGLAGATALLAAAVLRDPPGTPGGDGASGGDESADSAAGTPGDGPADAADGATDTADDRATDDGDGRANGNDGRSADGTRTNATGDEGVPTDAADADGERAWTWREAVRTWQFWLLYAVFVVVNGVGLMVIGKVVSFAAQLSLPAAAGTASASLVALADAGGVLAGGSLSDWVGRRRTVAASLVLCGVALGGAVAAGAAGFALGFVGLVGAAAFFRSPTFSVFPALVGEYYGRAYSSENYAALYTAKLFGGVIGGTVASALVVAIGWSTSFLAGAVLVALAGLALTALRPVGPGSAGATPDAAG